MNLSRLEECGAVDKHGNSMGVERRKRVRKVEEESYRLHRDFLVEFKLLAFTEAV